MNYYPNGTIPGGGPGPFIQNPIRVNQRNALSNEEIASLRQAGNKKFDMEFSPKEAQQAMCTHIDENGIDVVQQIAGTNKVYCNICGAEWDATPMTMEEVVDLTHRFINLIQNCKWMIGVRLPIQFQRDFWLLAAAAERVPAIWEMGLNSIENSFREQYFNGVGDLNSHMRYNMLYSNLAAYGMPQNYNGPIPQFMGGPNMPYGLPDQYGNMVPFNNVNPNMMNQIQSNMMPNMAAYGYSNTPYNNQQPTDFQYNPNAGYGYYNNNINMNPNVNPMDINQPNVGFNGQMYQQNNGMYVPQNQQQGMTFGTIQQTPPQQQINKPDQPAINNQGQSNIQQPINPGGVEKSEQTISL